MEIIHNYFDNVDPAGKDAPHLGLPRRHKNLVEAPTTTAEADPR